MYLIQRKQSTWHVGLSTKETDLADRHDHRIGAKQIYHHTYLQSLALFVEQTQFPLNLE